MADGKILITLDLVQKGDKISLVQKDTEKLASSTDKVTKSRKKLGDEGKKFHKREKGIAQSNLSTAKGFSKMKETMTGGGSSSLVAAYATLAANIFAATAAFNALRTAAQVNQLVQGFTYLANESGRTATLIAGSLRDITEGALSMEEALRASSLAIASGFRTDQLEELATVAKNASTALGRNLGDSVDRLIRGVAKLEPEILDELGIMVRLDDAVEDYAASLGKAGSDLTQFERRQAFLNATIDQGRIKYGALGDEVKQNPWEKLAATLADLAQTLLGGVTSWITPFIEFLSQSQYMLLGLIVAVSSGIINQMFPVLTKLAEKSAQNAVAMAKDLEKQHAGQERLVKQQQKAVSVFDKGGASIKKYAAKVAAGTATQKDHRKAVMNLKKSEDMRFKWLFKNTKESFFQKGKNILQIRREIKAVNDLAAAENNQNLARAGAGVRAKSSAAGTMENIGAGGPVSGFKDAWKGLKKYNKELKVGESRAGNFNKVGGKRVWKSWGPQVLTAAKTAGQGVKFFGAALVNAIPFIGQILFAVSMLVEILSKFAGPSKGVKEAMNDLATVSETVGEKTDQLAAKMAKLRAELELQQKANVDAWVAGEEYIRSMKIQAGVTDEMTTAMSKLINQVGKEGGSVLSNWWEREKNTWKAIGQGIGWMFGKMGDGIEWIKMKLQGDDYVKDTSTDWEFLGNQINKSLKKITEGSAETIEKFDKELPGAFDKAAESAPIGPIKTLLEEAGKLETGTAALAHIFAVAGKRGIEVSDMQVYLDRALQGTNISISNQTGNLTGLGDAMGELSKNLNTFSNKMVKKNEFRTISNQINATAKAFTDAKNQVDADGKEWSDVVASLGTEFSSVLEAYGITEEQVKKEGGFDVLVEEFENLADLVDRHAKEQKMQKYFIQEAKAVAKLNEQMVIYDAKIANLRKTGKFEISAADEMEVAISVAQIKADMIKEEQASKLLLIQLEYDLMDAKLKANKKMDAEDKKDIQAIHDAGRKAATAAINMGSASAANSVVATLEQAFSTAGSKGSMADRFKSILTTGFDADTMAKEKEKLTTDKQMLTTAADYWETQGFDVTAIRKEAAEIDTTVEGVKKSLKSAGTATNVGIFSDEGQASLVQKIQAVQRAMQPMFESLKALGPEGELAAALGEGSFAIADSFARMAEEGADASDKLMAVASIIAAIGSIAQASANKRIKAIDAEIKAEQKKDGKSKESLAKISAMEKKKDAIARKAFETNKKMMIASAIASTAAAVVGILGMESKKFGWLAVPMALAVGAMGLAQVAIIARQKYEGGGGAGQQASAPQAINIGKRSNRIDTSKQANAGELSYLRGEKGIGSTAQTFTPTGGAAGLIKNYAAGGVIVGEQGPEIISPRGAYEVTPNGALAGNTTNANFTINAIDAQGVEDVLTNQTGNIISMIRSAAHDHGEEFIEAVDTNAYGDASTANTWTGKGGG